MSREHIKPKLTDLALRFLQNKEIVKERNEENEMILDEMSNILSECGVGALAVRLLEGYVVIKNDVSRREVLDKEGLANEILVDKNELKTAFDISMLTKQEKLKPAQITKHTHVERTVKTKVKKVKRLRGIETV